MNQNIYKKLIIILVLSFISLPISSSDRYIFEVGLSGLPTQMDGSMVRDHDGFLWFPYFGGIARYDGNYVKYIEFGPNSISGPSVIDIKVDHDGKLWILTKDTGLNSYDKKTDTFTVYTHNPDDPTSISVNQTGGTGTQRLLVDSKNRIFIATLQGLNIYDQTTGTFTHYKHSKDTTNSISSDNVTAVIEDSEGYYWIGTYGGGLNRFNEESNEWKHYEADLQNKNSLSSDLIWSLLEDHKGQIWVGTWDKGLCRFDRENEIFTQFIAEPGVAGKLEDNQIQNLYEDKDNNIWISHKISTTTGLERYDPDNDYIYQYYPGSDGGDSISSMQTSSVYQDPVTDIYWIMNSYSGFIDKIDPSSLKFPLYKYTPDTPDNPSSLYGDIVMVIEEDVEGNILLSVVGGIDIVNPITKEVTHIRNQDIGPNLGAITLAWIWENPHQIWMLGINGVLSLIDTNNWEILKQYKHDENDPDSIMPHSAVGSRIIKDKNDENILWIGLSEGMERFDIKQEKFTHFVHAPDVRNTISQGAVWDILDDGKGTLWICAIGGLSSMDKNTQTFKRYIPDENDPSSIGFLKISTAFEDSFGNFWIGSFNGGFDLMDRQNETFEHFNKSTGFPSYMLNQTIQQDDEGYLWIGTGDSGLVKFDPRTKEVISHYIKKDGLQDNAMWRSFKSKSGQLWFGGGLGINAFYPDEIPENTMIPPVKLTSLSQGGVPLPIEKAPEYISEITLPWNKNFFEFGFAVLNYSKPEKNEFAYKLEGWDKDWYYSGKNSHGRYTGLSGGTYRLLLKGANNDGYWNDEGQSIVINVEYPLWETIQFRMAIIIFIILFIALVIWYIYKLRKEISFRKTIQQELQLNKDNLEVLVQERTKELSLTNSRLELEVIERKEAEEAAQKANQAKSIFLANMSHEIRTPLNAVTGFSELLSSMVLDIKQKSYLDSIKTAGKSLLTLINDILDLSKIEAGQLAIRYTPMDIRLIIQEIQQIFAMKVQDKSIKLYVEIDDRIPETLLLDETRIRQILLNLVGNAVKFTDQGYVKIIAQKVKDNNKTVDLKLIIEDTGIGIPKQDLDKIFLNFTQQAGQEYKKYGGTGLGLSITRRLTELMNGTVTVESKQNEGSKFTVLLTDIEISSMKITAIDSKKLDLKSIQFHKSTILIADDIESNRILLSEILSSLNLNVILSENGQDALQKIKLYSPDLVFMDLQMPVLNGIKATKKIKNDPDRKFLPVIALTASTTRSDKEIVLEGGFDGFLAKPIKIDSLLKLLSQYLPHDIIQNESLGSTDDELVNDEFQFSIEDPAYYDIKEDFIPFLLSQKKALIMDEMKEFCARLTSVGNKNGIELFTKFSDVIIDDINNFDIQGVTEKIKTLLERLRKMIGVDDVN